MIAECEMVLRFRDGEVARIVARSVDLENAGYIQQTVEESSIRAFIRCRSVRSLRRTVDDYLACIRVAEVSALRCTLTSR